MGRHKSIPCSVYMKYKDTPFLSVAFHAVSHSFAIDSMNEIDNINDIPSDCIRKDKNIYITKEDGIFIAEGLDHRNHLPYGTDRGKAAAILVDDSEIP